MRNIFTVFGLTCCLVCGNGGVAWASQSSFESSSGSGFPSIITHTVEEHAPLYKDDSLDGHCERDGIASSFQRCRIYSPANNRFISIHFKPSSSGSKRTLMLLDGASAIDEHNRWINLGGAARILSGKNINVVLPIGGGASYYTDFQYPYSHCSLTHPSLNEQQWETFLTHDLIRWARMNRIPSRGWSVGGFSMGGGAALSLAERYPRLYSQALSYSGMNMVFFPGEQEMLTVTSDNTVCMWAPFGSPLNPSRYEYDPYLNAEKLAEVKSVYLSAATGVTVTDYHRGDFISAPWEWAVLASTVALYTKTKALGLENVIMDVIPLGSHTYWTAQDALKRSLPLILRR